MDYRNIPADDSGYIKVDGGRIYYRRNRSTGKGLPLIAVHGGPGNTHEYLLPLLDLLPDRDIILYDQLNTGKSGEGHDTSLWNLERFTGELDSLRDTLNLEAFHIFGSSWGGSVAANYAAHCPHGLKSIILSGPLIETGRWIADNDVFRKQLPQQVQAVLDRYEAAGNYAAPEYLEAVEVFYRKHLCRKEEWPECLLNTFEHSNKEQYHYMWGPTEFLCTGILKSLDLRPVLKQIEVPVLFINGEFDEGTPASALDFSKEVKRAQTCVIKDASHTPHIEQPEAFKQAVRIFLREVEG